jgi:hypothetical protein
MGNVANRATPVKPDLGFRPTVLPFAVRPFWAYMRGGKGNNL